MSQNQKALIILFGGTGDLAYRKLYPALYKLYKKNYLNDNFAVIGTARRKWSDDYYQEIVQDSIEAIKTSDEEAQAFASHFHYQSHNVNDTENYRTLRNLADKLDEQYQIDGNRVFYLSMSPEFFGTITEHLQSEKLVTDNGFNRVIFEKPFGSNLEDSTRLNNEIQKSFDERQIYRIDHYLGKDMVQSLISLRFANPLLSQVWNKEHISNIQVTLAEDIGVEDRGAFYEQSGALRDMVQNHILQIVSLLYMDEPESADFEDVALEKINALKNLKLLDEASTKENFVRGQYTLSEEHSDIADYLSEHEVGPESIVETFVAGKIESENESWEDVPIYIRTGKRMKAKETRIDIVFKDKECSLFDRQEQADNVLTIEIGPNPGLSLQLNNKQEGHDFNLHPIQLEYEVDDAPADDYEKLILDALQGNKTSFVHWEEVAYSWRYVDAIREAWTKDAGDLKKYPAHTNGPVEADELLKKNGHYWIWN